ncbi:MAG TPA: cohesin domain-containing protein [Terracidiphilus sp.]|jgi:general secretion pathway protein D|nr:cohesin domain-containing protein [Terracidiphilus sp.]
MNRSLVAQAASRLIFRIAFSAVVVALGAGSAMLHGQSAKSYYKQGSAAEAREDYDTAFNAFQKAYSMAPKDLSYKEAYYRVQIPAASLHMKNGRRLMQTGDEQGALTEYLRALEIEPGDEAAQQEINKIRALHKEKIPEDGTGVPQMASQQTELDTMAAPVQLQPMSNEPLTLHMVEDSKIVYQAVGKAAGVNVLFDPDYTGKRIQVDLNNVSLLDALRIVGTLSNTFWRPVTNNTIFVAANTRSKRAELDEEAVQTFYLTNAWQQNDLTDVQTAIRNVLPNAHAYGVASQNAIVMRGTPDELLLAQKLVNDLDKARPEVVVDIAVLEVSKNWERTLGIAWPQSAAVTLQSPTSSTSTTCPTGSTTCTPGSTSTNPTLYNLAHLNSNDFAVNIGTATANALLTDSNTKTLQNPRIRSTDGQKATMKIGSRIPIATGSFQSGVGVAAAVTPLAETQFQYIDVGVNIEMTPTVHYNHDVTMKLAIEVSSESNNVTIEGVTEPIIAQKKSEQTIRLHEGDATVLTGILNQQDIQSWTGIPGLSSIPILKYLFGSKDHQITDDEIVFLLVPHIVRSPDLTNVNLRPIDTGAGQSIELRRMSTGGGVLSMSPVAPPVPVAQPGVGTVPGQTAQAAGPEALAQLRSSAVGNAPPTAANGGPPPVASPPGGVRLALVPSTGSSAAVGSTIQVPVVITGAHDIASVPLEVKYDPAKLSLVNVGDGDFLNRDGQTVTLIHTDDATAGEVKINTTRPPGAAGISGAGVVCVLSFQAKTAGQTTIGIERTGATTSAQQLVQADLGQTTIVVK